jgi:hypothetical protein
MEADHPPISPATKTSRRVGFTVLMVSLILLLLFATRGWFMGSYRSECILNVRNIQQSVRGYQGMNGQSVGNRIDWNEIIGPGKNFEYKPKCPAGGTYTFSEVHPPVGELACKCSHPDHEPPDHKDW